jgi:hypothetical protein
MALPTVSNKLWHVGIGVFAPKTQKVSNTGRPRSVEQGGIESHLPAPDRRGSPSPWLRCTALGFSALFV